MFQWVSRWNCKPFYVDFSETVGTRPKTWESGGTASLASPLHRLHRQSQLDECQHSSNCASLSVRRSDWTAFRLWDLSRFQIFPVYTFSLNSFYRLSSLVTCLQQVVAMLTLTTSKWIGSDLWSPDRRTFRRSNICISCAVVLFRYLCESDLKLRSSTPCRGHIAMNMTKIMSKKTKFLRHDVVFIRIIGVVVSRYTSRVDSRLQNRFIRCGGLTSSSIKKLIIISEWLIIRNVFALWLPYCVK